MRLFPGRRTIKYIGLPAIVSAGLVWKGTSHYKSSVSWPTDDILLNVQVFHRHGDRLPATLLRNDRNTENELWANKPSKLYSILRYKSINKDDDTENFTTTNNTPIDDIYQWKNIAKRLNGTYIVHKKDNYNMNSPYLVSSKDTDKQTQDILSNMECWDSNYTKRLSRAYWTGQLSDNGVEGMIQLGIWLRERYINQFAFLSPTYNNDAKLSNPTMIIEANKTQQQINNENPSMYYISTNFTRTIQSADALLQGLYPLNNRYINSNIPIHVDYRNTWLYVEDQLQKENEVKLSENDDENMIVIKNKLLDFYGREDAVWLHICDAVGCRLHHGIDLPPEDVVSEQEIRDFINYVRFRSYHGMDRESVKLTTGVLLNKLVDNMNGLENKFVIYSGHDGTIQRLLVALANVKDFKFPWPAYSSHLIFEVWEKSIIKDEDKSDFMMSVKDWFNGIDRTRSKYVRVLYEGNIIHLNGEEFIPIDVFGDMWKDIMIDDETYWNRECVC
eukprot:402135_1